MQPDTRPRLLETPLLSRTAIHRAAELRTDADFATRLLADASGSTTDCMLIAGGSMPVRWGSDGCCLVLASAQTWSEALAQQGCSTELQWLFLGQDEDSGRSYVALIADAEAATAASDPAALAPEATHWATLRDVGALLNDRDVSLAVAAAALANWHSVQKFCSRCGTATEPMALGWAARCSTCNREVYPRTDPAVIMSITDADDRILLGRQPSWPQGRYSTLAGFVDAGESCETTVIRESWEEAGVRVADPQYLGSQPWPFPQSLMLAFTARALSPEVQADEAEIEDVRWFTREQLRSEVAAGTLLLPPTVSVARRLIETWLGESIEAEEAWREGR